MLLSIYSFVLRPHSMSLIKLLRFFFMLHSYKGFFLSYGNERGTLTGATIQFPYFELEQSTD